jgi:hypothetical protein
MVQLMGSGASADRPRAFVWLGPGDDPDLSEAVGQLLESSSHKFQVAYVGPKDITAESLKTVKLLAFPGGAGMLLMSLDTVFFSFWSPVSRSNPPNSSLPPLPYLPTVQSHHLPYRFLFMQIVKLYYTTSPRRGGARIQARTLNLFPRIAVMTLP